MAATANRFNRLQTLRIPNFPFIHQILIAESCPVRVAKASGFNYQLATCHLPLAGKLQHATSTWAYEFVLINKSTNARQSYAKRIRRVGVGVT